MSDELPAWADRIRRDRLARGKTQLQAVTELRGHAHFTLPSDESMLRTWKRWETGKVIPTVEYQAALAAMFGSVTAAFFSDLAQPEPTPPVSVDTLDLVQQLRGSSVNPLALDGVRIAVDQLCSRYAADPGHEVRRDAEALFAQLHGLTQGRIGLREHTEVYALAGWLTLLIACLHYDDGNDSAAESARNGARWLGEEAGHTEILAWAAEIKAWMALTRGDFPAVIAAAREGLAHTATHSASVQLYAQEAKAWSRLGNRARTEVALDKGRDLLEHLPYPDNPRNHFQVDPSKFDFYVMDCYRGLGEDAMASSIAESVIRSSVGVQGRALAPMRIAEAALTQATVQIRSGDLDGGMARAAQALDGSRRSLPSLLLVGGEFSDELVRDHPGAATSDFLAHLHDLRTASSA